MKFIQDKQPFKFYDNGYKARMCFNWADGLTGIEKGLIEVAK